MSFSKAPGAGSRCGAVLAVVFLLAQGLSAQQPSTTAPSQPQGNLNLTRTPEDWSSLSLAGSQLEARPPFRGERDQTADFIREIWQVQWRNFDPIDLYVIRPQHAAKPPVVLYLYSYPSETRRFLDNDYCQRLTESGFAAIGFVSALTGHRYHSPRPPREWFVSQLQESLGSSVHDVQMILNYLATRGDLDMTHVGMFGVGSGASIAILAAAADPRITALDLLDPWGDWPDWMAKSPLISDGERADLLGPEFLNKVAGLDPVQWLPKLKTQPIRLQELATDPITPAICRQKLEAAAPPSVQLVRYSGEPDLRKASSSGHFFQWIKEQLRPATQAAATASPKPPTEARGTQRATGVR
jgi:hypothetical protein